jgi:pteridine reductase
LVTGAGIRLGRVIAKALAAEGAEVALHHHGSTTAAAELQAELAGQGQKAALFNADLTLDEAPAQLARAVETALGPISILVNSAARFDQVPFVETSLGVLESTWRLNARAPYLLTQAVAASMLRQGGGDVVNVVDIGGTFVPWQGYSAYCMSKAALGMLTQVLALELAPTVRVNAVAPGTVLPPEHLGEAEREALRKRIPLQRFGSPEDIAQTVLFFLTGPSFVTGQILAVDGGRMRGTGRGF